METSVHLVNFTVPGGPGGLADAVAGVATAAEAVGCTSLSLMDHWFQLEQVGSARMEMLEGYTTLGFLAAHTTRLRLGLLVTGVTYRHPGLLAKIVTTLDVLSGGRAELGIGAAWYEREHAGLGVPFPPLGERFERLEETVQICLQMWSEDDGPFHGRHYRLEETLCSPRPLSTPRPRLLIGSSGERKGLRLVARYADACNMFAAGTDVVAHKLDVLRSHCDAEGTDYDAIEKTILYFGDPYSEASLRELAEYAALGVGTVVVMPPGGDQAAWVEGLAPTVERLAQL